jgi:hypothetical protein
MRRLALTAAALAALAVGAGVSQGFGLNLVFTSGTARG